MEIDKEKLQKLLLGTAGIYLIYCTASVLQEWIMAKTYLNIKTGEQEHFQDSNAFVLIPSLIAWLIGAILNRNNKNRTVIPNKNLAICGLLILLTSLAFNKAIYVTDYPLVMLFKSCNVLSVITIGIFCSRIKDKGQKLTKKKLIPGIIITIGILFYNFTGDKEQTKRATNLYGVALLIFSLLCDGFLPDFQGEIKVNFQPTPLEMFEDINKWKTYFSLALCIFTGDIVYMYKFFSEHPAALVHIILLGTSGAIGQIVVYWMIKHFKQHIVPFVITTRKLFTVVISILFFNHNATWTQYLGIFLVFATVIAEFGTEIRKTKDQSSSVPTDSFQADSEDSKEGTSVYTSKDEFPVAEEIEEENGKKPMQTCATDPKL